MKITKKCKINQTHCCRLTELISGYQFYVCLKGQLQIMPSAITSDLGYRRPACAIYTVSHNYGNPWFLLYSF